MIAMLPIAIAAQIASTPDLGKAEAACRPRETGPAFLVEIDGLRDRSGLLKLEVYPANDVDFLSDDDKLVEAGKVFRRVEMTPSAKGPVRICVRVPASGPYALSLLHDRNGDHRFNLSGDGVGFAGNPKLGWRKPAARSATAIAENGPTPLRIVVNYRHGLSMRPDRK